MLRNLWTSVCENHHTSSNCTLRFLHICFGMILSFLTLSICLFHKESPKPNHPFHCLRMGSTLFNGTVGSLDLILGFWILIENQTKPLSLYLVILIQGFTWLFINLVVGFRGTKIRKSSLGLLSIFCFFYALISSYSSVFGEELPIRKVLDVLLLFGSLLLLLSAYNDYRFDVSGESSLYEPLNVENPNGFCEDSDINHWVGEFAKAGLLSKLSFWWLNSLMKRGNVKDLEEEDIPELPKEASAGTCYSLFSENLDVQRRKLRDNSYRPSILKVAFLCVWKEVCISGCFAFTKILSVSVGPLLLNAFILVAEGNERFRYEGIVLAVLLFASKSIESLSQRQWYFRSRLVGLRIRSLLTAAIYKKQLRLNTSSRLIHSGSEIMNYATVDSYRIGEFPYWFHQLWTTIFQLLIALMILFHSVGVATFSALAVIILTVLCNAPIAKLQSKFQSELMTCQDERLKACNESLVNMKVLKLYAWETHFKNVIEKLRFKELKSLKAVQMRKSYNAVLFWSSPVFVSAATFATCYFLNIPLRASNVFTFVATLRLVQEPVRTIPDVIGVTIQAKVAFSRISTFLEAPELLHGGERRRKKRSEGGQNAVVIKSASFSWEEKNSNKPNLRNVNLEVKYGEKVAICGEVGSGKSTLLAAILGETPCVSGTIEFYGTIAYVSQTAWIQTGTIRDNNLFGSVMDEQRYGETIRKSSLSKDLELLPDGDQTEIGERGVNLSGGQKQRIQLARALYQNADIYLLDDPFSAVDAHTASSLFDEYVMDALAGKAVLLVTHQVDFLPAFDKVLLMSDGEITEADTYQELLSRSREFQDLVNAHRETAGSERVAAVNNSNPVKEINKVSTSLARSIVVEPSRLINLEEKEKGDTGLRPYIQYMNQSKGYIYFIIASIAQFTFAIGQILQNSWMAANVENPKVSTLKLILVYLVIGLCSVLCLLVRSFCTVVMSVKSSTSLFFQLLNSLFRAPMSFYDSTPLGRILSRVSSDLSIVDLDVPFGLILVVASTVNAGCSLGVLVIVTWQVLFVSFPMVYLAFRLQKYYFQTTKELMRINGTTRSLVANHLAESVAGAITIRAFDEEERFFKKNLTLIDINASPFFYSFSANEWLIQRLEFVSVIVLASTAFCMVLLPTGTFSSGFIGMALSYGLSLNTGLVSSVQNQCSLSNWIISVERLNQYAHLQPEPPVVIEDNRPPVNWPVIGRVEISDLQIRYRRESPLVLKGISCVFEGGHKIGIVGRTGSGKTTLISALFRLVEPAGGKIVVDGIDISKIGVHDLRSRFGIIPQDPTLFNGTVRYNLDPLCQHTDAEVWEVLEKCQLKEVVQEKEKGLDSLVVEDGSNWSMGQRQLFCLGRAVLRKSRVLVLDEATASVDNATDLILQKTIRREFADCTVITVAHRIPTVMDCTMVLSISDGRIMEYDEPMMLMKNEDSLFGKLVKEYWSQYHSADSH